MDHKNGHLMKATIYIMLFCQQITRKSATEKVRKIKVSKPLLSLVRLNCKQTLALSKTIRPKISNSPLLVPFSNQWVCKCNQTHLLTRLNGQIFWFHGMKASQASMTNTSCIRNVRNKLPPLPVLQQGRLLHPSAHPGMEYTNRLTFCLTLQQDRLLNAQILETLGYTRLIKQVLLAMRISSKSALIH